MAKAKSMKVRNEMKDVTLKTEIRVGLGGVGRKGGEEGCEGVKGNEFLYKTVRVDPRLKKIF